MKDKITIDTKIGDIEIVKNKSDKYPGAFITIDGVPVLLLEQVQIDGESKLLLKKYHNNKVIQDDNYINFDLYNIVDGGML